MGVETRGVDVETRGVGPDQGRGSGDPEKPTRARELDESDFNPSLNARALPIKERTQAWVQTEWYYAVAQTKIMRRFRYVS